MYLRFASTAAFVATFAVSAALGLSPYPGFTYQGKLIQDGHPYNGSADLAFSLYDAVSAGSLLGTQAISGVNVSAGLFTVVLNGANELGWFNGDRRWLEVSVNGTPLAPRQEVTAAPFALTLRPGAIVSSNAQYGGASINLWIRNSQYMSGIGNPVGLVGTSYALDPGFLGFFAAPVGVYGSSDTGYGVAGASTGGYGLVGTPNWGVEGRDATGGRRGILGHPNVGVYGDDPGYSGNYGGLGSTAYGAYGVWGATGTIGMLGINNVAVFGQNANGVYGGVASADTGVYGVYGSYFGYLGRGDTGVLGNAPSGHWGGLFYGNLGASGTKSFRIDHPLDPENKYLLHYSAEGPAPLNIYTGTVVTGEDGAAWVELPDYFAEINRDYHYALTVVDDTDSSEFVQVKIARTIADNRFKIRTSRGNVTVCWEVKGVRNDVYVRSCGTPVEVDKPANERGRFQHPELYGRSADASIVDALQGLPAGSGSSMRPEPIPYDPDVAPTHAQQQRSEPR